MGAGDKTLAEFIINLAGPCARLSGKDRRGQKAVYVHEPARHGDGAGMRARKPLRCFCAACPHTLALVKYTKETSNNLIYVFKQHE